MSVGKPVRGVEVLVRVGKRLVAEGEGVLEQQEHRGRQCEESQTAQSDDMTG
jgi:hypothetical protein